MVKTRLQRSGFGQIAARRNRVLNTSAVEALGGIVKQRGMTELARACGLARESLYRSLGSEGNPEFATILKVLQTTGLKPTVGLDSAPTPGT
jgi:probable addiction module antidote protein